MFLTALSLYILKNDNLNLLFLYYIINAKKKQFKC